MLKLVLLATFIFALGEVALPPELFQMMLECAKEFNISEEIIKNNQPIPEDKKCWYKCFGLKAKGMDEAGNVYPGALKEILKSVKAPDAVIASVDDCMSIVKPDPCDRAMEVCHCLMKNML